jgi:eukaryotic-like serine/threonine-protein kinase
MHTIADTFRESPRSGATAVRIGRYRVERLLGSGAMGVVYAAFDPVLGRRVAIKVVRREFSEVAALEARFLNEARAAAGIADPGAVQIFDAGKIDGCMYLVMELLEGELLEARIGRDGPLPIADALLLVRQIASTVGLAHARGIVHRDLKPENIFIVRDSVSGRDRAKVLDFGIAKLFSEQITEAGAQMGTPHYMAPEQWHGADVDARADVYALGCMLFTMLTGAPPFDAPAARVMQLHVFAPAPLASNRRANIPIVVDDLISRCLAKNPAERFANGAELGAAIDLLVEEPPPPLPAASAQRSVVHRLLLASLVGLVVGLLAVALLIVTKPHSSEAGPKPRAVNDPVSSG